MWQVVVFLANFVPLPSTFHRPTPAAGDTAPNTPSCGKSFTSVAAGILIAEHPGLFADGLDQRVYSPRYLPPVAFPLDDPHKAEIRLGQLLAMTAGLRGDSPGIIQGREVRIDPPGPDGWQARVAETAAQLDLWCAPGEGYSYATSSAHLVSMIIRHVSGMELQDFVRTRLAEPLRWGPWGWGYQRPEITHTPGGWGIAVRPTDMLRFGYLLLRQGKWAGRQVVPAGDVRGCAAPSRFNPHSQYSLQFDVNGNGHVAGVPPDAFWKLGSGGHSLYIVPSLDLVIWKMGGRDGQYAASNTGLPLPPGSRARAERRNSPRRPARRGAGAPMRPHCDSGERRAFANCDLCLAPGAVTS